MIRLQLMKIMHTALDSMLVTFKLIFRNTINQLHVFYVEVFGDNSVLFQLFPVHHGCITAAHGKGRGILPPCPHRRHHHHHHDSLLKPSIKQVVCFGAWTVSTIAQPPDR
jgi:hypothetical protein